MTGGLFYPQPRWQRASVRGATRRGSGSSSWVLMTVKPRKPPTSCGPHPAQRGQGTDRAQSIERVVSLIDPPPNFCLLPATNQVDCWTDEPRPVT